MATTALAPYKIGLGLGAAALLGGSVVVLLRRQTSPAKPTVGGDTSPPKAPTPHVNAQDDDSEEEEDGGPNVKSRVHGFKISKLTRLVDGIAQELGKDDRVDTRTGEVYNSSAPAASAMSTLIVETETEQDQFEREHRTLDEAVRIVKLLRSSGLPKKLPHFQVTNRHLEDAINLLGEIADNIEDFWRYSRDEPLADLFEVPLLRFAAENIVTGGVAMVPKMSPDSEIFTLEGDCALLGVEVTAEKDTVVTAFRRKAFELHEHGHCVDVDLFHRLNNACQRRIAHGRYLPHVAFASKDDLAVHLLVGADPRESRYREPSAAIMDAVHRERLLQRIHVVRNWGEVGGSITGLGQG